jgi:methionyl aminopeptidase
MFTRVKSADEITAMREGGRMLAMVLKELEAATKPGVTPKQMSTLAAQTLQKLGGQPAFKGYQGYPDIICISVNNQVQHSIPTNEPFKEGDAVNYDFGVQHKGLITDAGITVGVGQLSPRVKQLIEGTQRALLAGVDAVKDGCHVGDISAAIEAVLRSYKLGIVRDLVGHGVGDHLHEDPNIPNYGSKGGGSVLKRGMTIAIEPIATLGSDAIVGDHDGWTLWTADGSWSAQFEHTLVVTDKGAEILTIV